MRVLILLALKGGPLARQRMGGDRDGLVIIVVVHLRRQIVAMVLNPLVGPSRRSGRPEGERAEQKKFEQAT